MLNSWIHQVKENKIALNFNLNANLASCLGSGSENILFPFVDPAGAARSDPASGWSDSAAPGSAGSASADHHPAATGGHHGRTEPGAVFLFSRVASSC